MKLQTYVFFVLQSVWTASHGLRPSVWTPAPPSVRLLTNGALALRCWKSATMGMFPWVALLCLKYVHAESFQECCLYSRSFAYVFVTQRCFCFRLNRKSSFIRKSNTLLNHPQKSWPGSSTCVWPTSPRRDLRSALSSENLLKWWWKVSLSERVKNLSIRRGS